MLRLRVPIHPLETLLRPWSVPCHPNALAKCSPTFASLHRRVRPHPHATLFSHPSPHDCAAPAWHAPLPSVWCILQERGMRDHTLNKHRCPTSRQGSCAESYRNCSILEAWRRGRRRVGRQPPRGGGRAQPARQPSDRTLPVSRPACSRDGDLTEVQRLVQDEGWTRISNKSHQLQRLSSGAATATDRHGSCALMWAAGGGTELCKWLVSSSVGMDPRCSNQ